MPRRAWTLGLLGVLLLVAALVTLLRRRGGDPPDPTLPHAPRSEPGEPILEGPRTSHAAKSPAARHTLLDRLFESAPVIAGELRTREEPLAVWLRERTSLRKEIETRTEDTILIRPPLAGGFFNGQVCPPFFDRHMKPGPATALDRIDAVLDSGDPVAWMAVLESPDAAAATPDETAVLRAARLRVAVAMRHHPIDDDGTALFERLATRDPDPVMRAAACAVLLRHGGEARTREWLRTERDARALSAMMHELGRSYGQGNPAFAASSAQAATVLTDAVQEIAADRSQPEALRRDALLALTSRTHVDGVVGTLVEAAAGSHQRIREAAIQSLATAAAHPGVQDLLVRALDDPHADTRMRAAWALMGASTTQAAEALARQFLGASNPPGVRSMCAQALSGMRRHLSAATLETLRAFLADPANARLKESWHPNFWD